MSRNPQKIFVVAALLIVSTLSGCKTKFEKLRTSNNIGLKYQEAVKYYDNKKFSKALILFDDLNQRYRGQAEAEDLLFYLAYSNYRLRDYSTARYHFGQFASSYPYSNRAEEARFMAAYCYYQEAPRYSLDQDYTLRALESLQLFINLYPESNRVEEAENLIAELRNRLEFKAYQNAKLYLDMGLMDDYRAAVIAFETALRDYPDSQYAEEIEFLQIKAQYLYGINSTFRRQEERLGEVLDLYERFVVNYPQSKFSKDALGFKNDALSGIETAKKKIKQMDDALAQATSNN